MNSAPGHDPLDFFTINLMSFDSLSGETTIPHTFTRGNGKRDYIRAQNIRRFVGVDGEGISQDLPDTYEIWIPQKQDDGTWIKVKETRHYKSHQYVLLSVGNRSLHHNGAELSFDEILEFLWDCFLDDPDAIYVGFYLDYDYTNWFKWLTDKVAWLMLSNEGAVKRRRKMGRNVRPVPVTYGRWLIDIHANKRFRMRHRDDPRWLYINDMGPFFQTSFMTAIDPKKWPEPICSDDEYALLKEGKERRNIAVFDKEMIVYNQLENVVLARVAAKLNEGFTAMGVSLKKDQWYGPGQAAQAWMLNIHAPERRDVESWVPKRLLEMAKRSYYGGWFIIPAHGTIPGITYEYDRNSAYPYEIARLPCLRCGRWEMCKTKDLGNKYDSDTLCLVDVTVRQDERNAGRFGSMPYRTKKGMILQPRNVRGVYWMREIEVAKAAGCIDSIKVHEAWIYVKQCEHKPFAKVAGLYADRQRVGKNTPLGIVLKLIYNSIYGKCSQSIGEPRFANPIYASLITSGCRCEIWAAIASHPGGTSAVTMVATDAVFFTSEHPGLVLSNKLGDWSCEKKSNLTQFMPGLYWDDAVRASKHLGKIKSRGVNANDMREVIEYLDWSWQEHKQNLWEMQYAGITEYRTRQNSSLAKSMGMDKMEASTFTRYITQGWPTVTIPVRFGMISARLALHRKKWRQAGRILETQRIITADPVWKRNTGTEYVEDGICWTLPYSEGFDGLKSTPYDKRFGMDLRNQLLEHDVLTGDQTVDDELYEWVRDNV